VVGGIVPAVDAVVEYVEQLDPPQRAPSRDERAADLTAAAVGPEAVWPYGNV
jgi:hypothetical protein